jgi:SAM-dependent methyltransferase
MAHTRPLWRRTASRARAALYRLATPLDRLVRLGSDEILPPAHLRKYYYRTFSPSAFTRAAQGAAAELMTRGLRPDHRVLDIGSGIGNLALGLAGYLTGGYDGVEIHPEAVAWCQRAITPRHPQFRFHRADLVSQAYNPHGRMNAATYRFPFPDASFDAIPLFSVFTHMLPDGVENYLREISRLLAPGGTCVAGYFLLNGETTEGVRAGRSFMSFPVEHASGLCRLHDPTMPEAAVALDEDFVRRVHDAVGLRIGDIRRGRWWSGESDDQDIVTVARENEPAVS